LTLSGRAWYDALSRYGREVMRVREPTNKVLPHKVNITVDGEIRARMDEFPEVNYSKLFRTAVRVRTDKMRIVRDCEHDWAEWRPSLVEVEGYPSVAAPAQTEELRNCTKCGALAKRVVSLFNYDYTKEV
jgi:hypothetical protein